MTVRKTDSGKNILFKISALITAAILIFAAFVSPVFSLFAQASDDEEQQSSTPYEVYIGDFSNLLSDEQEEELYNVMLDGIVYGNMVFVTTDYTEGYNTKDYIEKMYQTDERLKGTSAVIYMIDMDNRLLWISGYGDARKTITPDYGNLITDNIYKYAKDGDYYTCAVKGFEQICQRLAGSRVSGSLRSVGNLCTAVIVAEIICFAFAYVSSASKKAADSQILENLALTMDIKNPTVKKTGTRKVYDPVRSSSSSGGSRGGGGGGGFSGGGGGHGF